MRHMFSLSPSSVPERWEVLPPTPAPIPSECSGRVDVNEISIYYAIYGRGRPVILLHGGMANADYWGHQVPALATHHTVIVMDSRAHGRTTRDLRPLGYDLMADDVVALMDALDVPNADMVGWSDGAATALDLAMRHPVRVGKIFAFAATTKTTGTKYGAITKPTVHAFIRRAAEEYKAYSATPKEFSALVIQLFRMWSGQPSWTDAQLAAIATPVLVVGPDHDETIKRAHTESIAAAIPGAELLILPDTSHFAFLQDPERFNAAVLHFLGTV
jgi:pimeloyl-ACP methyl ester carboxylesterase